MRSGSKDKRRFITVVSVCFFLCVFVFSVPAYAAGEIAAWGNNNFDQCEVPLPNTGFTAIAAGFGHSLGLKSDGSIVGWGSYGNGQCTVPSPNTGFTVIAAGQYHSLGLKQNGSIFAWGDNGQGQCNVPSPNTGFIAVSAGRSHSLGLKSDGSIVGWGSNYDWDGIYVGQCNAPSPNTGFTAIAAGAYHSLGLKADGSIVAWGDNGQGQCNVPSPNTGFIAVAAGFRHSLGLKQNGSIVVWGWNSYYQCNVPPPNTGFTAIAGGGSHSLGLKNDGSIVAWGNNDNGQCTAPSPNTGFTAISGGAFHSLGLKLAIPALTFSPDGGTYTSPVDVTISCQTSGATIHYTTNGVDPTESDPVYSGPVHISATTTLKAGAWKTGWAPSVVKSANYTITGTVATPAFTPDDGTYINPVDVNISCGTSGATIHYTTNGVNPTESDPVYSGPVHISATTTLKAGAWKTGWAPSVVKSANYTITGTVATPAFTPDDGTYINPVDVNISCGTSGATIHYTTNGVNPTESDPVYSGPVHISATTTLKAGAWKTGWAPSVVKSANYTITGTVATPAFTPDDGTYINPVDVNISCGTSGATIHYTTNGVNPTESDPVYSGPVHISATTTLKAGAWKTGWAPSVVKSANYTITGTVATPAFTPDDGTYINPVDVNISCGTSGATIHYTTNGVDPTESDPVYSGPVHISATTTLKAGAWKTGWAPSVVKSANYTITGTVATPAFTPDDGTYINPVDVNISCGTSGATIHYTTNGVDPTESDPVYSGPVHISATTTLKAGAWKTGWAPSVVKSANYTITGTVATPAFTPDDGTYINPVDVNISCGTSGATIHYTTNGVNPTESDPVYSGPVHISATTTLKAGAWKTGWAPSVVKSANYTITGTVATPAFTPDDGTYINPVDVNISCGTSGATIHYTTNGVNPTESDPVYSGPVHISATTTLKAGAWKTGWAPSVVKSANYTITGTVATPAFTPDDGTYINPVDVNISCQTSGATIHYTTNGVNPTESDPVYSGPVHISATTTLKAGAWKTGWAPSVVKSANYTITGTVATPAFTPDDGTYINPVDVNISCGTSGATIHYTTNGVDPTESDPVYSGPVHISATTTLKAGAWKTGWAPSVVKSANYTITGTVATPAFTPDDGTYINPVDVNISCGTSGATIHYTTNGVNPTESDPVYSGPVHISATTTLKAGAWKTGWAPSVVKSANYTITGTVATPAFTPDDGTYINPVDVNISCGTSGATIHYTTNGVNPTESDPVYSGPVHISATTTLKAGAWKTGWAPSVVKSANYTITGTVATPAFTPDDGTYINPVDVNISCGTSGATIHYTTNGVNPTESDPVYSGPVHISATTTLKAGAWKTGWAPSVVKSANYTITGTVATPAFTPDDGTYINPVDVNISCGTSGATIHYTTNGVDPTESDPVYSGPVHISATTTLKAGAWKTGWAPSVVKSANYTITGTVATPAFTPDDGTYINPVDVNISCGTSGATIHYTTNGVNPTESDPVYSGPVHISATTTLKAGAWKTGWAPSVVKSANYTITGTVATPAFTPDDGTYINPVDVNISCQTSGATIHYTTNGVNPTESDPVYSGPVHISATTTLKAGAWKSGWAPSGIATVIYSIISYASGEVAAWGYNPYGECNIPSPNIGFTAVAAGYAHSLGLKQDGSIAAWGNNEYGECNVPEPNTGFTVIVSGTHHSIGLKADGSIVAWGNNDYGQCEVPSPNTGFVTIAAGFGHSLVLKADGSIMAWGNNDYGQCEVPLPNTGFIAIAAGEMHSLGLKQDGSIAAWGNNYQGECNVLSPNTGFTAIAAGAHHSLGLKQDGSIAAWGNNDYGECNVPEPNTGFTAVAAGEMHSLGLKQDSSIVAWGNNDYGQCYVPSPNTGFTIIAGGGDHSLGLKVCQFNLVGDLNGDCKVDFYDLAIIGNSWLVNYDMYDVEAFANYWLVDCFNEPNNPACVHK